MEKNEIKLNENPRKGANPLSVLTFKWLFRIFFTGYKRELELSDLYSPLDEHSSRHLGNKITRLWDQELERCQRSKSKKKTPSLLRVLVRGFGCEMLSFGFGLAVLEFFVKTTQPIILANLLKYFHGNNSMERSQAYFWGTSFILGIFLDSLISHFTSQELMHVGMKIRVSCCSLMYRKILNIAQVEAEGKTSIGQIINLLSNNVSKLDLSVILAHYMWITPIQTAIISYLLYREVGLAVLPGMTILLLFIPIHGFYGKLISYLVKKVAERTDERLRLINQILSGIKVIKMYAWEKPFAIINDLAREKELRIIKKNLISTGISRTFKDYLPRVCLFLTVLVYILLGNNINADKVYLVTSYYYVLRTSFFRGFTLSTRNCAEALVSVKRITKFLLFEEIKQESLTNSNDVNLKTNDDISLSLRNVTANWNLESKFDSLKGISFQLQSGFLTAVVGKVGAGKSTLLQAILREIPHMRGEIKINGKISYASQEPWLFASSIKQNILLGKKLNKERYKKVIEVCQLKRDFQLLPYGENTLVGELGMNLSGGQRARINLARAVYHEADIYLLDDPFSAVDAQVSKGIFDDCIKTFLKGKTIILITHQLHYLKYVDRIIILDNGTVMADGIYTNLLNLGFDLTERVEDENKSDEIPSSMQNLTKNDEAVTGEVNNKVEEEQSEIKSVGSVAWNVYIQYFKAARNYCLIFLVFVISIISQVSKSGADYFIKYWVNIEDENGRSSLIIGDGLLRGRDWYIYAYGSITVFSVLVTFAQAHTFYHLCKKISKNLHAMMFSSVINAKMAFFNANPIGRIMNRFSKDMEIIDTSIPEIITDVMECGLYTFAIVCIVVSVNPWFLLAALVIAAVAYLLRSFYVKTSYTIKRLEGITRSPVFNHLRTTVHGLTTIRALNAQEMLTNKFYEHQDQNSAAWFIFFSGSRAFAMYIDFLCAIFTSSVIYTLLSLTGTALVGDAGLVITQCTLMTGMVQWGVRQSTELENQMVSVERILEYLKLEQESSPVRPQIYDTFLSENQLLLEKSKVTKTLTKWPQQGHILFKDVSLTFDRQEKPALKNLNFTIEPKEKIGIVGRTGAGKSSLINALFRLVDIKGEIYIDNVATSRIALHDLRSKISVIPQEPVLFAGSLRMNLDPFEEYSDHTLWQALEDVGLKGFLQTTAGLSMSIAEGGTNFSIGQRQLLCLARAIIRNNNLLVLDEATANIDLKTDELVQKTIREKFVNCTVLIIAHRLNSVMDSNKILVMDAGQVVEFDHPYNLLQQRNGIFYNMVQQMGSLVADSLFQVAKLNYEEFNKK